MNPYIQQVCKLGHLAACCRYLIGGEKGLECAKSVPALKVLVDKAWATDAHVAQGDNCAGQEDLDKAKMDDHA